MADRGVNLFDRNYRPIPGTHPTKYHTCYDEEFERVIPKWITTGWWTKPQVGALPCWWMKCGYAPTQ